jgi:hypothetical protein
MCDTRQLKQGLSLAIQNQLDLSFSQSTPCPVPERQILKFLLHLYILMAPVPTTRLHMATLLVGVGFFCPSHQLMDMALSAAACLSM